MKENKFENIPDSIIRNFTGKSYNEKERLEIRRALEKRQEERLARGKRK